MEDEPIQTVLDVTIRLLTQLSGDPKIGDVYMAFQEHGEAGPDGKEGTADDLQNPVLKYLE